MDGDVSGDLTYDPLGGLQVVRGLLLDAHFHQKGRQVGGESGKIMIIIVVLLLGSAGEAGRAHGHAASAGAGRGHGAGLPRPGLQLQGDRHSGGEDDDDDNNDDDDDRGSRCGPWTRALPPAPALAPGPAPGWSPATSHRWVLGADYCPCDVVPRVTASTWRTGASPSPGTRRSASPGPWSSPWSPPPPPARTCSGSTTHYQIFIISTHIYTTGTAPGPAAARTASTTAWRPASSTATTLRPRHGPGRRGPGKVSRYLDI